MARARLTDQCLWIKHVEHGAVRDALASLRPGSVISLLVDGEQIDFQKMATGADGRETHGLNPVGLNARIWRNRYSAGDHQDIEIEFRSRQSD